MTAVVKIINSGDTLRIVTAGFQGPKGNPGINWRGAWDSGTQYYAVPGDAVSHDGASYIAIQDSLNQEPNISPAYWDLLVGGGGGVVIGDYVAGAVVGGQRIVTTDGAGKVVYADKDTPADAFRVLGMTIFSAIADDDVQVLTFGDHTDPSFTWTPGDPIYLGNTGLMTQTVPTTGFVMQVGFAVTSTKMFLQLKEPIATA